MAIPKRSGGSGRVTSMLGTGGGENRYTVKQGQYLAFLYYYSKIHGRAPAEADIQRYFNVTPPTVHTMLLALEARGCIAREPGRARSVRLLLSRSEIPDLE